MLHRTFLHAQSQPPAPLRHTRACSRSHTPICGSSSSKLTQGQPPLPQAHLVGLHVLREVAASFDGLVASQVDGHHSMTLVLLAQLHHFQGPVCGEMPTKAPSAAWRSRPPSSPTGCPAHPSEASTEQRSQHLVSSPGCQVLTTWPLSNCSAPRLRLPERTHHLYTGLARLCQGRV